MSDEGVEVNGKIDLGTRRLEVSYVENAASFYAYLESEKEFMKTIKQDCKKLCEGLPRLTEIPETEQVNFYFKHYLYWSNFVLLEQTSSLFVKLYTFGANIISIRQTLYFWSKHYLY